MFEAVACRNNRIFKGYFGCRFFICKELVADGAGVIFNVSVLGAGCFLAFDMFEAVACRNNRIFKGYFGFSFFIGKQSSADIAFVMSNISFLGAGRVFCFYSLYRVRIAQDFAVIDYLADNFVIRAAVDNQNSVFADGYCLVCVIFLETFYCDRAAVNLNGSG